MNEAQIRRCTHLADYCIELIEQGLTRDKKGIDTEEIAELVRRDLEAIAEDIQKLKL